jgi:hypothetical protein
MEITSLFPSYRTFLMDWMWLKVMWCIRKFEWLQMIWSGVISATNWVVQGTRGACSLVLVAYLFNSFLWGTDGSVQQELSLPCTVVRYIICSRISPLWLPDLPAKLIKPRSWYRRFTQ